MRTSKMKQSYILVAVLTLSFNHGSANSFQTSDFIFEKRQKGADATLGFCQGKTR